MVQLLVVITIVFNVIKNRDFFVVFFNDHQKLDHRKKSPTFEFSQIWFHEHIKRPPAPQKSVLGFGLAQKLGFWGPSIFYLKIISKSFLPETAAASKMVRFSIWGCQNDGEKSPNKVCEVNFFRKCIKILSKIQKHTVHLKKFWGMSNPISRAYRVPSSTPKICPRFDSSSKIVVLRSKHFLPQNHLKKFASGGHCDLKNATIFNLRVPKWPREKSK